MPEGRQIFPTLTVEENLIATAAARFGAARWQLRDVYEMFPSLAERRRNMGNQLSGGEQQMLAIGRSLMTNPKLLILDEATEGLAPLIRNEIWTSLKRLKAEGQAILLVDKHIDALLKLADRHVVIEKGYVVWSGSSAALTSDPSVRQRYLQVDLRRLKPRGPRRRGPSSRPAAGVRRWLPLRGMSGLINPAPPPWSRSRAARPARPGA